jgi:hypothetical protein
MICLDLRGVPAPFALLKVSNTCHALDAGQTIELLRWKADIVPDLVKILPAASCALISVDAPQDRRCGFRICLKKKSDCPVGKHKKVQMDQPI